MRGRSKNLIKKTGLSWLLLIASSNGPHLQLKISLPCKSGVGTLKAKGVNPDRKF
jgi:hypothetical protein